MSHDAGPQGIAGTRVPHHNNNNNSNTFRQQEQADVLHGTGYFSRTAEKTLAVCWTGEDQLFNFYLKEPSCNSLFI